MALREMQSSGEVSTSGKGSAVSGLPTFWDSADTAPRTEWEEWWDLFEVASNAKHSLSVTEVLRELLALFEVAFTSGMKVLPSGG